MSSLREMMVEASPLRRVMLVLVVVVPLLGLAAAYYKVNPPDYRVLYANLSDRAGGEVITALEQLDIPYRLSARDGTVEVPADQLHAARYRLAARGLPKTDEQHLDEAERGPSFGASSLQEQQRFQRALETDLARSIQKLDAIELARVHLALPKVSPFLRDAPAATAAVLVRVHQDARLTAEQVTTIQTLVAAGVPRMKRTDVQVLDPSGVVIGVDPPAPIQSRRLTLEKDLANRVRAVLSPWLGADRVRVQITATLDDAETRERVEQTKPVPGSGRVRAVEKTVRTSHSPEGRVERIQAVIIMGFDATANERWRAGQMARQALGYDAGRGDTVNVYALPLAASQAPAEATAAAPELPAPPLDAPPADADSNYAGAPAPSIGPGESIPRVPAAPSAASAPASRDAISKNLGWLVLLAALIGVVAVAIRRRRGATPTPLVTEDFEAELEAVRGQVSADPRVAADVIRLWMRA